MIAKIQFLKIYDLHFHSFVGSARCRLVNDHARNVIQHLSDTSITIDISIETVAATTITVTTAFKRFYSIDPICTGFLTRLIFIGAAAAAAALLSMV